MSGVTTMNSKRRTQLDGLTVKLREVQNILGILCDQEQESMENMPESLQESDRYYKMDEAVDNMTSAIDKIDEVLECITEACA